MVTPQTWHSRVFNIVLYTVMILLSVIFLYPLLYVLYCSFSDPGQLTRFRGVLLYPLGFSTTAYKAVLGNELILSGYKNTLFVLVVGLVFNIVLTCIGAYFLTRTKVYFYKPIMIFILLTMYFSGGLIPFFLTVRDLGMYNSIWALIIPSAISTYNMILLRSYFSSIPESIVESVSIDGGGHWTVLFKIYIPLSKAAMAVMVLYYGVGHWNSWFNAMIFLRKTDTFPLQLILRNMLIEGSNLDVDSANGVVNYEIMAKSIKSATIIIATVPILCIYPFLQKYFVGGMMIGSLKE